MNTMNGSDMGTADDGKCLELALEGERLCKSGDFESGVVLFETALDAGTADIKTLSAIYSQLGNAYFYLGDYVKAFQYHKLDLTLTRTLNDSIGEAKASGNLGNTLKMLAKYDEAILYCTRHLDIARRMKDKVGEGRALYNLANVFHTKGKQMAKNGPHEPNDLPDEVRECLIKAIAYYERNLSLMEEVGDRSAQGRACGNIGNTHYLLGNFKQAVQFHEQRLQIAYEFQDKAAERRAQCNLGNAHIFLGEFEKSVHNYKQSLRIAQALGDRIFEAQSCYSLGNTYSLLRDYQSAIEYHLKHLDIARSLKDRVGESRAYWSLGNAYNQLGKPQVAFEYANKHLQLSIQLNDRAGQETAKRSVCDLSKLIASQKEVISNPQVCALPQTHSVTHTDLDSVFVTSPPLENVSLTLQKANPRRTAVFLSTPPRTSAIQKKTGRKSMENMELLKLTPTTNQEASTSATTSAQEETTSRKESEQEADQFLDLLANFQSKRMDDQRCSLELGENKENHRPSITKPARGTRKVATPLNRSVSNPNGPQTAVASTSIGTASSSSSARRNSSCAELITSTPSLTGSESCRDELFDLIAGIQGRRMDEQRAPLPPLRRSQTTNGPAACIIKSCAPSTSSTNSSDRNRQMSLSGNILPDDEFFDMLMRCQASRLEDQRSVLPSFAEAANNNNSTDVIDQNLFRNAPSSIHSRESASASGGEDEFFSLIMKFQAGRIEDQRTPMPTEEEQLINLQSDADSDKKSQDKPAKS